METKKNPTAIRLLPQYFKIIGLILIFLAIVIVILKVSLDIELLPWQKKWAFISVMDLLILGMFLIAMSKDKVEDEMTFSIRLNSMATAFGFGVIYTIVRPISDQLLDNFNFFRGATRDLPATGGVIIMLLTYLQYYYFQKRRR